MPTLADTIAAARSSVPSLPGCTLSSAPASPFQNPRSPVGDCTQDGAEGSSIFSVREPVPSYLPCAVVPTWPAASMTVNVNAPGFNPSTTYRPSASDGEARNVVTVPEPSVCDTSTVGLAEPVPFA